jgi:phage recombination protein Bet
MKQEQQTIALNNQVNTKVMTYNVGDEEIKLSGEIVRKYLVRGNANITDQDLVLFMNLCKYQKLNPFLNEAYLIKFGNEAQIVTGKEAFMKRAENHPDYEGLQAGIIIIRDGKQIEVEGTFYLPTDKLVGGWAKVYRKDKKFPFSQMVSLTEYDKKQSQWKDRPSTMIRKVAIVQAMREAFPTNLGAMYTEDEMSEKPVDVQVEEEIKTKANMEVIDIEPVPEVEVKDQGQQMAIDDEPGY